MSIESQISRLASNVSDSYSAVSDMGGELPASQTSDNLAGAIRSIPKGGGDVDPAVIEELRGEIEDLISTEESNVELVELSDLEEIVTAILELQTALLGVYEIIGGDS